VIAHLVIRNNCLTWSGYNASGDPAHTLALVVDVGRDFLITSDGKLYLNSPGPLQFAEFSPGGFAVAARSGMLGFTVLQDDEATSWRHDRIDQERRKLGRRGRIARDSWER
jgi:alkanesulfonate monooxygenase SsuD/methylene tetrahydromethanopterin reductase-like flavin-dependent oxidoreductase (luciferase family)